MDGDKGPAEIKPEARLTCRGCGGEHWTAKCPFKALLGVSGEEEEKTTAEDSQTGSGKYVPPGLRYGAGGRGAMQQTRDESCTIRITNLSEYATEQDLSSLLQNLGNITRIFLAKDYDTGYCKGYAFVSFCYREEAERAIEILNGHGFGNLIIKCEFAKER